MAFTKAYARIAAGMLDDEQLAAMKFMALGSSTDLTVSPDTIASLVALGLARHDINLMDNSPVFLLTANGKKVAEILRGKK